MLRMFLLGTICFALMNLGYGQEEYIPVHRVEDLPPLEDVYTTYRLPNNTQPNSYDVSLRTWIHEGNFVFNGSVSINISIEETTNTITLHHRYLTVDDVQLWSESGNRIPILSHSYNTTFEFLTVSMQESLLPDEIVILDIDYNGTLRTDEAGFYRSSYVADDGSRRWLATTQFESTDARHAFPCYDEPNKKATFTIRITHDPSYSAISNMPEVSATENADGSITTEFEETPLMSTYLVAFIVSDFGNLASSHPRDVPQRTFARPNAVNQSTLMLSAGERIMDASENYLGVNYSLPKMDQAGIPDFSAGAMENWGLVTYRESYFFYNESVTTYVSVLGTVKVIAHEFVHQWFGNLVSPSWWTYLWLNEGFARFVEHIGVNLVYPDWQMIDYFVVRTMQNVYQSDASVNSRPMSLYVEHPNDIERQFSNIAYDKAGSVLRMFMNVLTEATFLKGLNLYLNEMSFSNAVEGDLFSALNTAAREDSSIPEDIDVATTMSSWSQQAGFPVVTVTRNYDEDSAQNVTLSQKRYFTTQPGTPDNTTWWIPINYATARNPNFDDTTADEWFPQNHQSENFTIQITSLTENDWLIVNKQESGYYRVMYDQRNYMLLSGAMHTNIDTFHNLNRAQLIDDTYNFVRTDSLTYSTFLHVSRFLAFEHEYAAWYPAITAFTTIDRYFAGHADYPVFREHLLNLIEHLYTWVGVRDQSGEPHMRKYSRTIAVNWACNMGSSHCRADATAELRGLIANGGDFHQNVRDVLYCAALRGGNQNDFDFVWNRVLNSNDAATRNLLLNALGCSTTRQVLIEFIRSSLSSTNDRGIQYRAGEAVRVFNAVYQNGLDGLDISLEFLNENMQEAYTTYGSANFGNILTGMAQRIGNERLIEQVCKDLDIKCETEYFGLVIRKPSDKPKTATNYEWINLRNPLPQINGQHILLELRVKFWVPAHLILQDSVRNIFYMQARLDLLEGRLKAISWENAAKLGALLAQADEIKYDDTCVPAESLIIEPKKNCDTSSTGKGKKRKLSKQRSVDDCVDEVALPQGKVKSVYEKSIIQPDTEEGEKVEMPSAFLQQIAKEHKKLISLKMSPKSAKYWLLESISKLPRFGEEIFTGTTVNDTTSCDISVGPCGIVVYKPMEQIRIPFSAASSATPMKNLFRLTYLTEDNSIEVLEIKMPRSKTATCLYRAITEKHAFYSCETVCSDVTTQFIRDLKGTIASIFNVDTKSGRLYVFDIERTCREVHDHARRILHLRGIEIFSQSTDIPELNSDFDELIRNQVDSKAKIDAKVSERIGEAMTCLICVDHSMNSIFIPCGHVLCFKSCALRCETCPLCRSPVSAVNKIFLPTFQSEQKQIKT